jgi:hypothetical protein
MAQYIQAHLLSVAVFLLYEELCRGAAIEDPVDYLQNSSVFRPNKQFC